jgi:hypothetical protein
LELSRESSSAQALWRPDRYGSGDSALPLAGLTAYRALRRGRVDASDCVVIDNFPPFVWASPNSGIRQWYASVEGADSPADREHVLQSKETVELSAPQNVVVRDGKAYMTFSATWRGLSRSGKRFSQGAVFTVIERQTDAGWRIEAHSWGQSTAMLPA